LLSGCAYIRLFQFKNQLRDFDQFVKVDKSEGLAFVFETPILKSKDFVFITGAQPTRIVSHPADESLATWVWQFDKVLGGTSMDTCSIAFATTFRDGVLERMDIDNSLLEAMDADFMVAMLKSLGVAKINKLKRAVRAEVKRDQAPETRFPSLAAIKKVFGRPTKIRDIDPEVEIENEYVFNFIDPSSKNIAGQFKVIFQTKSDLDPAVTGFVLSGKGR